MVFKYLAFSSLKKKYMFQTFSPNLPSRFDRQINLKNEFSKFPYFNVDIVSPVKHNIGVVSLWLTIQYIIKEKVDWNKDFFIFCEDDHQFTENFNIFQFEQDISSAKGMGADILLGGVSWFKTAIQISTNLFWVEKFTGLQFTIVFKKFYQKVIDYRDFTENDAADYKFSSLSDKKFVLVPFISTQKEFGYSDVTKKNNQTKELRNYFKTLLQNFTYYRK